MKDPSNPIRRKLRAIAEIRYQAIPTIFDIRGKMIGSIHPEISDHFPHWQTDIGSVTFLDNLTKPTREFQVSLKKSSIILEDPGSIQEFIDRVSKYLGLVYTHIGPQLKTVMRFGVRLIEIFEPPSSGTFADVVSGVASHFLNIPSDLTAKPTDIMVNIIHERGMYYVGPVKKGEPWIQQMFKDPERNVPNSGIGIDVDSYTTDIAIAKKEDLLRAFQSVYELSKAVEESLLRHQGLIDGK